MTKSRSPKPLGAASVRALLAAPWDGSQYFVPYSVAQAFARRGWAEMLGTKQFPRKTAFPDALIRLTHAGTRQSVMQYALTLTPEETHHWQAVQRVAREDAPAQTQSVPIAALIETAQKLVTDLEAKGARAVNERAALWALVLYQRTAEVVPL